MSQKEPDYSQSKEFKPLNDVFRVNSYRDYLCLLYAKPMNSNLSREHWNVTEISIYKDRRSRVQHEYLVAKLSDGARGEVYLRIERRIRDSLVKEAFEKHVLGRGSQQTDSSKPDGGQVITAERPQKRIKKYAVDELSLFDPKLLERGQHLVDRLVFKNKRMSLPQLVILACAITDHSKDHYFFEKNCYWFCYCAGEALKQRFNCESVPVPEKRRQGTWLILLANSLRKDVDFSVLLKKYDSTWSAFEQGIQSIVNHPDNQDLKTAKKRVEEHCAEKKRAEDLERQLAELKAQLA
ncbi:hypothetical protein F5887DRAFT_922152 [Amanita rubescens]|nr:hypothetical protein F5887DRAFT_922152 [Amanita rubescens]